MIPKFFIEEDLLHYFKEEEKGSILIGTVVKHAKQPDTTIGFVRNIIPASSTKDAPGDDAPMVEHIKYALGMDNRYTRYEIEWSPGYAPTDEFSKLSGMIAPLVRRVGYSSMARSIVSVQPMTMPSGNIFYTNFQKGSDMEPEKSKKKSKKPKRSKK